MKRIISLLLTLCLLAACGLAGAESKTLQGKPWVNSNLYGQWPDERPGPEDGYDMYANYEYYREALASQAENAYFSRHNECDNVVQEQFLALCKNPEKTGTEVEALQILYRLYMDTEKREQEGLTPLQPCLDRLKAVKTPDELTALFREDGWMYGPALIEVSLTDNITADGKYRLYVERKPIIETPFPEEETLEMPGPDVEGAKKNLCLMGYSEEEAAAAVEKILAYFDQHDNSVNLETNLEEEILARGTASLNEIGELCPPVREMLMAQGLVREGTEADQIYQVDVAELILIRDLYREENLDILKAAIALGIYEEAKAVLPKAGENGETVTSLEDFEAFLPQAIRNQAFLHSYVPQERIDMYYSLVDEYKEALRVRFEQSSWLSEEGKKEALRKLENLVALRIDFSYGDIDCGPLLEKLRSCETLLEANGLCAQFERECKAHFSGLDFDPANRYGSSFNILMCEGKYDPATNMFCLGGGSLAFDCDVTSRETILGSLGVHMAHEISHAFDTTGAQNNVDKTGPLFTDEDMRIFIEKATAIAQQVSNIQPLNGLDGNGAKKIGEVLADMTGMSLTLDLAKKDENFDYDAMFRAFAWFFFAHVSESTIPGDVKENPHPLPYIRINFTVQHFDEFYQTYPSVTEGTPMYMAPEDRLLIW